MGVFLIIVLFFNGLPATDFRVFQSMKECKAAKVAIEAKLDEMGLKPEYLECKSAPADSQPIEN
jgi:hypothetical protein